MEIRQVISGLALAYIGYLMAGLLKKVGRRTSAVRMMVQGERKVRVDWVGAGVLIMAAGLVWQLGQRTYGEVLALVLVAVGLLVEEYRTKGDYGDIPDIIRIYESSLTRQPGELREALSGVRSRLSRTSVQQALDESLTRLALGSKEEQGLQPLKEQSGYLAAYVAMLKLAAWQKSTALDSLLVDGMQRLSREMRNPLGRWMTARLVKILRLAVLGGLTAVVMRVLPGYSWEWLLWVLGIALIGAGGITGLMKQPLLRRTAVVGVLAVFVLIANGRLSVNSVKAEAATATPTAPALRTPTAPMIAIVTRTPTAINTATETITPSPTAPRIVTQVWATATVLPTEREDELPTLAQPTEALPPTPTAPPLEKPTAPGIP